ncbi:MAG: hypothetical protein KJ600_01415 [Nanoarchaeota archaeon]|nr:hypothetical protein [Nanoarchaeota archaeon]MBU1103199.1 hypothetical protein [Nanoarchaeota archaeon]
MAKTKAEYLTQLGCEPVDLDSPSNGFPLVYTGPFNGFTAPNVGECLIVPDFLFVIDPTNFGNETSNDKQYLSMDYSRGIELRHNYFYRCLERAAQRSRDTSGHLNALTMSGEHPEQRLFYASETLRRILRESCIL